MQYHGIILDLEFTNPDYPNNFNVFAKRKSKLNPWTLFGIEVEENDLETTIASIQENMKRDKPYYAHLYSDKDLIVIFKNKVFYVKPHKSTWGTIIEYGRKLGIPEEQLDFWPNRFQDEIHYFEQKDFVQ